jgi:hypothetical protein
VYEKCKDFYLFTCLDICGFLSILVDVSVKQPKELVMKTVTVIDYNATLQEFFKEIIKFLDNRVAHVKSEMDYRKICKAREDIAKIAANPKKYADYGARVQDGIEPQPEPYMPNPQDNSIYVLLSKVLHRMGYLNSELDWYRKDAETILLRAMRVMVYKNSTNLFKDIKFMFMSDERFGVKKDMGR